MRWFKHMTDASDDNFIESLEDIFGLDGYARWWKMLEVIARGMDKNSSPSAEHSWVKWQSFLKGKRNKLETFLEHCQNKGKITLELNGNILKINCPMLLKLRDEYSSRSGQAPVETPDKVMPLITDTEKEKNNMSNFDEFRQAYPLQERGFGSVAEAKAKLITALKRDSLENIITGAKAYGAYIKTTGQANKDAFRWLEKDGWRDDYTIQAKGKAPEGQDDLAEKRRRAAAEFDRVNGYAS